MVSYVSGGIGMYAADAGYTAPFANCYRKIKPNSSIRLMWHPDHLVRFGLETGYMTFYSYTFSDSTGGQAKLRLELCQHLWNGLWRLPRDSTYLLARSYTFFQLIWIILAKQNLIK
jgi:hypothetical protein